MWRLKYLKTIKIPGILLYEIGKGPKEMLDANLYTMLETKVMKLVEVSGPKVKGQPWST